ANPSGRSAAGPLQANAGTSDAGPRHDLPAPRLRNARGSGLAIHRCADPAPALVARHQAERGARNLSGAAVAGLAALGRDGRRNAAAAARVEATAGALPTDHRADADRAAALDRGADASAPRPGRSAPALDRCLMARM